MSPSYEGIEPQFDLAAQDSLAEVARKGASKQGAFMDDRTAKEIEDLADQIKQATIEAEQAEVPEVPGPVEQEPELAGEPEVAPPDPDAPAPPPPTQADLLGGAGG